jgi:cytosine/adenosine deaminase-related metal-dependent hydrolase
VDLIVRNVRVGERLVDLGVEDDYGIEEGKPADFVVFDAPSALEVMRLKPVRRWVVRRGRVIAETTPPHTTLLGEEVSFSASAGSPGRPSRSPDPASAT